MATTMKEDVKEELEILESSVTPKAWTLNDGVNEPKTYVQKPLSFFGKIEFFSLIGDAVDQMSTEERPLNLQELFGGDATTDSFVAVISRLASQAPETLQEAYCIWLSVPRGERDWAKWVMNDQLTDDEGFQIIDLFVEQNAEELQNFFAVKGQSLVKKISRKFGLNAPAPSSKQSKPTQPRTKA